MDWESAGAASERRKLVALPLTAVRPTVPEGFAPAANPVMRLAPIVVVETNFPVLSVPRSAEVMPGNHVFPPEKTVRLVVEALTKLTVEEATREQGEPVREMRVVVD